MKNIFSLLNIYNTLYLFLVSALLCSCTTDFDPEIDEEPMTVLNVLAQPDSIIKAQVSHSWIFNQTGEFSNDYSGVLPKNVVMPDANVECSVNGGEWVTMTYDPKAYNFTSDIEAKEGDQIRVRAFSRYGKAEGYTEIPQVVPIEKVDYSMNAYVDDKSMVINPDGTISHPVLFNVHYRVTFTDPGHEDRYYMIAGNGYVDDPIIGENETPMDGVINKYHYCSFFSNATIKGQTYTLSLFTTHNYYPGLGFLEGINDEKITDTIKLYSISKEYYLYILSLFKKYTGMQGILENYGVSDPRSIYTNVTPPGTGIVASSSVSIYTTDITSELLKALENLKKIVTHSNF